MPPVPFTIPPDR